MPRVNPARAINPINSNCSLHFFGPRSTALAREGARRLRRAPAHTHPRWAASSPRERTCDQAGSSATASRRSSSALSAPASIEFVRACASQFLSAAAAAGAMALAAARPPTTTPHQPSPSLATPAASGTQGAQAVERRHSPLLLLLLASCPHADPAPWQVHACGPPSGCGGALWSRRGSMPAHAGGRHGPQPEAKTLLRGARLPAHPGSASGERRRAASLCAPPAEQRRRLWPAAPLLARGGAAKGRGPLSVAGGGGTPP